ncbi:MAG: tetratricopeptide repeat protein [Candidatus Flexifilum sp.]|jgi:hypothetical protein
MSSDRSLLLSNAFDLIEAGQPDEARRLLEDAIAPGGDAHENPDAWWIYAHALPDPGAARAALNRVLDLDPDYPGARDLLQELDEQYPELTRSAEPGALPADIPLPPAGDEEPEFVRRLESAPTTQPGMPVIKPLSKAATGEMPAVPGASSEERAERPRRSRSWLPLLLTAAAVLLVIIGILALLRPAQQPAEEPDTAAVQATDVAAQPTVDATLLSASSAGGAQATDSAAFGTPIGQSEPPQIDLTEIALTLSIGMGGGTINTAFPQPSPGVTATAPTPLTGMDSAVNTVEPALMVTATAVIAAEGSGGSAVETAAAAGDLALIQTEPVGETPAVSQAATAGIETGTVEPTAVPTLAPLEQLVQNFAQAAPEFTLFNSANRLQSTALGQTAIIGVCSGYGAQLRQDITPVMTALASASNNISGLDAVAIQLTNCDSGGGIRIIGTPLEAAQQFAATGDELPYRLSWAAL